MGNMNDRRDENKDEGKENLQTEEIPPDTQVNHEIKETENEITSENHQQMNQVEEQYQAQAPMGQYAQQIQQIQQVEQVQESPDYQRGEIEERNEKGEDGEVNDEQEERGEEGEEEAGEEGEEGDEEEAVRGKGVASGEMGQILQVQQAQQQYQMQQDQQNLQGQGQGQGQPYQFVKDGYLYQVDENGQLFQVDQDGTLYKVIQDNQNVQMGQGIQQGQVFQAGGINQNQNQDVQYVQPIYQEVDPNQQQYLLNQGQNMYNANYLNTEQYQQYLQYQMMKSNTENYAIRREQGFSGPSDKVQFSESAMSPSPSTNRMKKKELKPKDSMPKMHIISDRGSMNRSSKKYMKFDRSNVNVMDEENDNYTYAMDRSERQLRSTQSNRRLDKNFSKLSLKEREGFVDIPREEYDNYINRETIVVNDGMETGEYQFIGAKTVLKDGGFNNAKYKLTEEQIIQEINRRNKRTKEKKVSYEVIDKFYALTEIRGKTIHRLEKKNLTSKNKAKFYASLETSNYNYNADVNPKINVNSYGNYQAQLYNNNSGSKYSNINNQKTGSIEVASFRVGNYKNVGGAGISSGARNSGGYYEFRKDVPFSGKFNPNSNYANFNNNINSFSSIPLDNYSRYLLEQINRIRLDPQSFIGVIEDAKANIIKDKFGRIVYNGKIKIALAQGESSFKEAIDYLKKVDSMEPLKYASQLTVIPPQNEYEIEDKDDLSRKVIDMINAGINVKSYWRDVIKDPQISFLLMIVDDNGVKSGMKRKDILNPNMKFIGISSAEINRNFACYITLS